MLHCKSSFWLIAKEELSSVFMILKGIPSCSMRVMSAISIRKSSSFSLTSP
jgi:hypothetical protein